MIFDTSDKYFTTVVEDCEKREELRRKGIRAEAVTGALLESSKSSKILAITTPHFTLAWLGLVLNNGMQLSNGLQLQNGPSSSSCCNFPLPNQS
jgi:hypothetical protein